jgi:hypothetical protein
VLLCNFTGESLPDVLNASINATPGTAC